MRRIALLFLLLSFQGSFSQGIWTPITALPTIQGRADCAEFSIGNYGYICTGFEANTAMQDLWRYDPAQNTWTQMANFGGVGRWEAVGFAIHGFGYITCGYDGNSSTLNDMWQYDPNSNSWTQKANFAGINRFDPTAFVIGNKGYVCSGGDLNYQNTNLLWEYNPASDSWTQKTNIPGPTRVSAVSFAIGNYGYVGLGLATNGDLGDFWKYDPSADAWSPIPGPPGPRNDAVGFAICQFGFVGTGESGGSGFFSDLYRYNSFLNSWQQMAGFPGGFRSEASAFVVNNMAYVGTGGDGINNYQDFYAYDWQDTCSLSSVLQEPNSKLLTSVYPIPFSSSCTISIKNLYAIQNEKMIIELYDIFGEKIRATPVKNENTLIDRNDLPSGIYFYKIISENKMVGSGKLIAE